MASNRDYPIGLYTYNVVFADFNGDGLVDLASVSLGNNNVSVMLGVGDGAFGPATVVAAAPRPTSIATGDFNGDGRPDLVFSSLSSNPPIGSVIVLQGNGDGRFTNLGAIAISRTSDDVVVNDFNGDGRDDIAVATGSPQGIALLLNKGDGTFGAPARFESGPTPFDIVTADFNGDGLADIATPNEGTATVSVWLGTGTGSFGAVRSFNAGPLPTGLDVGDFDRDGRPDLAVVNDGDTAGGTVNVLHNNGNGTFTRALSLPVGLHGSGVAVGDFNGDHFFDIAATGFGDNSLTVLTGRGDGTFASARLYAVDTNPVALFAEDLNGDGKTDLVSSNGLIGAGSSLTVLLNQSPYEYVGIAGDTVTVFGTTAPIAVGLSNGLLSISTPAGVVPVQAAEVGQIVLNGVNVTFTSDLANGNINGRIGLTVKANAAATFATSQHLATLTVNGTATLAPDGNRVLRVTGLSVAPTGRLDLADNAMVFDYKGAAQAASVAALIAKARSGGTWTGAGLTSSAAAANAAGTTTLGYLEATDYQSIYGTGGLFVGERLDTTAVLVRYTLYGDADLDRSVSIYDFNRLGSAFGATAATWFTGDFDYDSGVSINDFNLLGPNFGRMLATAPPAQGVAKGFAPAKR